jgi:UDP-N-acetylmuramate dehydrogenase
MALQYFEDYSLLAHNTFGIDVRAKYFVTVSSEEEAKEALQFAQARELSLLILGGGSNVLFTEDFPGIVIQNRIRGIEKVAEDESYVFIRAAAGENWHSFVMHCINEEWAGLENLSLIPGCVGASPMQNIGAYGVEISNVLDAVEAIHTKHLNHKRFTKEECELGYRESIFKRKEKGNWFITHVVFKLNKRAVFHTEYGAIADELDKMELDNLTIRDVSKAVVNIRSSKLPNPKELGNAGSFFKNPTVPIAVLRKIQTFDEKVPFYPVNDQEVKIPAGYLIEQSGWKGKRVGNCGVHTKQALVLVNYGESKGSEIFNLSSSIIEEIKQRYGITLEREVNIL